MRKLISIEKILCSLFLILICSCKDTDITESYELTGDWKVISFNDTESHTIITKTEENTWTQFNNGDNIISFIKSDSIGGNVSGINVTNSFYGNYKTGKNGILSIQDVSWTEINEPQWGKLFHTIEIAENYEVRKNLLYIFYHQNKEFIILEKTNLK